MLEYFSVIGIGQCGGRLAKYFEESKLKTSYFNFDAVDAKDIEGKKFDAKTGEGNKLILDGKGTGRSLKKGFSLIEKGGNQIRKFLESVTSPDKIVLLVGGLGGGTFSSSVQFFVEELIDMGRKVGVIATLPTSQVSGGIRTRENAYTVLKSIRNEDISFFILADNEQLSKKFEINPFVDGWTKINKEIVKNFLAIENLVQDKPTGIGIGSVDFNEVLSVLVKGGFTSVFSEKLWFKDISSPDFNVNEFFKKHELASGFDYRLSETFVVSMVVSKIELPRYIHEFIDKVLNKFNRYSSEGFFGTFYRDTVEPSLEIHILANSMPLPGIVEKRIANLNRDKERAKDKGKKSKEKTDKAFAGIKTKNEKAKNDFDF